jgi:hypothetical protein
MIFGALCFIFEAAPSFAGPPNNDVSDAGRNTAGGTSALLNNTTGVDNTAFGFLALLNNTTGEGNTAFGKSALRFNTGGSFNTAVGVAALGLNGGNGDNTAVGYSALLHNAFSPGNTAIGSKALLNNTDGFENTATGTEALLQNTTGVFNTANGIFALISNTTGRFNTATGGDALAFNTTGSNNIALGSSAGQNLTTGNNNIDIGNFGIGGDSNNIRIGTMGTHNATFIAGIRGATVASGVGVIVGTDGQLGTIISSARFKEAIKPMDKASEAILALEPVTFRYKHELDPEGIQQFGLVAEQVEKVNPDLVARDHQGKVNTVRYEAVNAMLLNEFLKEHRKVQKLEAAIAQQKEVKALTAGVKVQASQIRKVSVQLKVSNAAPQMAVNNQ